MRIPASLLASLFLICCAGSPGYGQEQRPLRFGFFATGGIKYPFAGNGSRNYHLFGDVGLGVVAKVSGSTDGALSFLPKLAVMRENTRYHHVSSMHYTIETINVVFNPEILLPMRNDAWQLSMGIGIDWMADMNLAYNNAGFPAAVNLDDVYDSIATARRKLVPFVSAGMVYQVYKGMHVQLFLRQDLRDAFPDDTEVTFRSRTDALTVNLSHQPTRLGLGILYLF